MPEVDSGKQVTTFRELPVVGGMFKDFDNKVGSIGLQRAIQEVLTSTGCKIEVSGISPQLETILKEKGVVLVVNHPFAGEPLPLIAVLPRRKDVYLIGASALLGIGPNFAKCLIPVYLRGHATDNNSKLSSKVERLLGDRLHLGETIPDEEIIRRNRQSIKDAAQKVKDGALVILTPEGTKGSGHRWLSGIGNLLNEIGPENDVYYVKAFVEGTSNYDPLRILPGIGRLLPKFRVTLDEAQKIQTILFNSRRPRIITQTLQAEFNKWVPKTI